MELTQLKEKENVLLSRKRISFESISNGATPSRKDLREAIGKKIKIAPEKIVIRHIYTKFGSKNIKIIAHVYNKVEDIALIEDKNMAKKSVYKKEEPKVEKAAEEPKTEEAATEEKTE